MYVEYTIGAIAANAVATRFFFGCVFMIASPERYCRTRDCFMLIFIFFLCQATIFTGPAFDLRRI